MNVTIYSIIFTILLLVLFLGTGWYGKTKTKNLDDFYVGGRGISVFTNSWAQLANICSLSTFMGFTGMMFGAQFMLVYLVAAWMFGIYLMSVLVAPYVRRSKKYTTAEFLSARFEDKNIRMISVVFIIWICVLYMFAQMKGTGHIFEIMFGIPYEWGVIIGGLVVVFYVAIGGMLGASNNQAIQGLVLYFTFLIPLGVIMYKIGASNPLPAFGYSNLIPTLLQNFPDYFNPFMLAGKYKIELRWYIAVLIGPCTLGLISLPHVVMRFFTSKTTQDARKMMVWTNFFYLFLSWSTFAAGFVGSYLIATKGLNVPTKEMDKVLFIINQNFNPDWVLALVLAGALCAAFSTCAGLLMVIGSSIAFDISSFLNINLDNAKAKKLAFFTILIAGLIIIAISLKPPAFLLVSIIWAQATSAAVFGPALVLSIWWKGATPAGAKASMLVGGISMFILFILSAIGWKPYFWGGPIGFAKTSLFTVSLSFIVLILVSSYRGKPGENLKKLVDEIHGWKSYKEERYYNKILPSSITCLSFLFIIWFFIP